LKPAAAPEPFDEARNERPHGDDCRCLCGNLLARVMGDRVELKCRRCKRTLFIPLAGRRAPAAVRRDAGGSNAPTDVSR
jgi:phage FluMu protein Com